MKIKSALHDVLVESVKNKKLFDLLMSKWSEQKPGLTQQEGEQIFADFQKIKEGLSPKRPQVTSFLYRFDGKHGYERFDPDFLKDITKYTYKQITSLIDEYKDDDNVKDEIDISHNFIGDGKLTPERLEYSKSLWFNPETAIVNEEGFRVYDIKNQTMAMIFGFYLDSINGSSPIWCVARRPDYSATNLWASYRTSGTFYFIIDESKKPSDRYYLSALQKKENNTSPYVLTSLKNDGDNSKSWNEIVEIYPKISKYKNVIVSREFSQDELREKSVVGQVNETEGNIYEFRRVSRQLKKGYINNLGPLRKAHSWAAMDEKLRVLYILTTNSDTVNDRFSNFEFLNEIKKVGNQFTLLDNRLKQIGFTDGVGSIMTNLMKNEFRLRRESLDNPQIKIYESKVNGLCGVYHTRHADWVKLDGIKYEPLYKEVNIETFTDDEENSYIVEVLTKNGGGDSFYVIYPVENERGDCHILTQKKWDELNQKLYKDDGDNDKVDKFDPEQDVDIKEFKKGE